METFYVKGKFLAKACIVKFLIYDSKSGVSNASPRGLVS